MNQNVRKAFTATRALGIADADVKPVLKNLLKLFDGNWELIEAENYRALIDGYFDLNDSKEESGKKRDPVVCDELENRPKRVKPRQLEDQVSSARDNSSLKIRQKTGESTQTISRQESLESSDSCLRDRTESGYQIPLPRNRDKGKRPMGSYPASESVKSSSQKASSAAYIKQTKEENKPCSVHIQKVNSSSGFRRKELVNPNTELSINTSRNDSEPIAVIYPGNSSTSNGFVKSLVSHHADTDDKNDGSHTSRSWRNIEIASSSLGDVKLSLKYNSSPQKSNMQNPDIDTFLKFMEDKYLRSYKIVQPQFSMMKLLRDLCESYGQLGTDSTGKSNMVKSSSRMAITSHNPVQNIGLEGASASCMSDRKNLNSHSAGIVQLPIIPKKPMHNLKDISKGSENVKISLVDVIGTESLPKFTYIPQNTVYQNAFPNISLARISDHDCCSRCSGDCLSAIPCECTGVTGGKFVYTAQGLLQEGFLATCMALRVNPQVKDFFYCPGVCPLEKTRNECRPERCKGHLVRKFIKECWRKCGCDMTCGNRVVQRGITCKLEVFMTQEGKGWGVRTLQDLPKGAFVCEYVGEILTNTELYKRNSQNSGNERHTYPVTLDADWGSEEVLEDDEALCLDATIYGNVARFINHRCHDANLLDIPVEVENPDHHYYHVAFFTTRDIKALEELTWDYGIDFNDHGHPIKAFQCSCQSPFCRGKNSRV